VSDEEHGAWGTDPADVPAPDERLQTGAPIGAEDELDRSLRPRRLDDFIGQDGVTAQLAIFLEAAKQRSEALDHVLLAGPPGLGKTSLAGIVAGELGVGFHVTSGPVLERKGDLAAVLTALEPHDVLFIDEIHRLNRSIEEVLYPAMEDFQLDVVLGQGPSARTLRLDLPTFTLIGATTRTGLLTTPLRARFGVFHRLDYYAPADLARIVRRSARLLEVEIDEDGAGALAARSRGTPRIANRLLRRVRDWAQVHGDGHVDHRAAMAALALFDVDDAGLDRLDRAVLEALCRRFGGGPVGLSTLAVAVGEESDTVETVAEPYLVREGYVVRTPRGRAAAPRAWRHLGIEPPRSAPLQDALPLGPGEDGDDGGGSGRFSG
jgi:Holliday junction DNA helicase RuvB